MSSHPDTTPLGLHDHLGLVRKPYREAWFVRVSPSAQWVPVLVEALAVSHCRASDGAWPPKVYGACIAEVYGEKLTDFLANNPGAEWQLIPWPTEDDR